MEVDRHVVPAIETVRTEWGPRACGVGCDDGVCAASGNSGPKLYQPLREGELSELVGAARDERGQAECVAHTTGRGARS
jgi:hypothetical protein